MKPAFAIGISRHDDFETRRLKGGDEEGEQGKGRNLSKEKGLRDLIVSEARARRQTGKQAAQLA